MATKTHKLAGGTYQFRPDNKNLFEVRAYLEFDQYGFRPIVQLSLFQNFKRDSDNSITMQLECFDLRTIAHAIRANIKAEYKYDTMTKSGDQTKSFIIGRNEHSVFVNMSAHIKIMAPYSFIKAAALADSMITLADELQRKMLELELDSSMRKFKEAVAKAKAKNNEG